jgi:hypothetical protein
MTKRVKSFSNESSSQFLSTTSFSKEHTMQTRNRTKTALTLALVALISMVSANAQAALISEFRIDLSDNAGSDAGWDLFTVNGGATLITDQTGDDNDVTLTITSDTAGISENAVGSPGATVVDGVVVPEEVNDDYNWSGGAAGTYALFEFVNLDAGTYNVSVFEGRTSDGNGQFGTFWVGTVGDDPGSQNTGDYAGGSSTLSGLTIGAGDSLFFRHLEDFTAAPAA